MAVLAGISIYPIKALPPISVSEATLVTHGALEHDREWAIFDANDKPINAKRNLKVHGLLTRFHWPDHTVAFALRETNDYQQFQFDSEHAEIEAWLSAYFGEPVTFRQNLAGGFPDDPSRPGPTVVSTATLEEVASWYPNLTVEEVRLRFRANLEIANVPAFWEDRLVGEPDTSIRFQIGDVVFDGVNPCQRCIVPTRDTATGVATPTFSQIFTAKREETLPSWATRSRFNHYYRLCVNTLVPDSEVGKTIHIGDACEIIGLEIGN